MLHSKCQFKCISGQSRLIWQPLPATARPWWLQVGFVEWGNEAPAYSNAHLAGSTSVGDMCLQASGMRSRWCHSAMSNAAACPMQIGLKFNGCIFAVLNPWQYTSVRPWFWKDKKESLMKFDDRGFLVVFHLFLDPKMNSEPKNWWFGSVSPFARGYFHGILLVGFSNRNPPIP